MKDILRTLVGLVVILVVLSIMLTPFTFDSNEGFGQALNDGFNAALILIQFYIVCTAGIGLFGMILAGYGVGWIVITIIMTLTDITEASLIKNDRRPDVQKSKLLLLTDRLNQELQSGFSLNNDQLALLNFIKKARSNGLNDEQISKNLTYNGWTIDSITAAFQMAGNGA